ncbi:MAG: dicarboxylate/amino acid:cation symporter [Ignavibacteriaceae bacterium]|nr:dicarboxylate/amino acid:cation symporter [Ignavibacteriaceae bacterium]
MSNYLKFPKLHTQILIALILGVLAGVLVKEPEEVFTINFSDGREPERVEDWSTVALLTNSGDSARFSAGNTHSLIQKSKQFVKSGTVILVRVNNKDGQIREYEGPLNLAKPETFAHSVKWIGDIFIRLLNMIAIPLVISTLIVGVSSLGDIKKFTKVGGRTMIFYLSTTAVAITIGLALANIIKPGEQLNSSVRDQLIAEYSADAAEKVTVQPSTNFINDFLIPLIPRNIFSALTSGDMLQIVFFAVFVGIVLNIVSREKGETVIRFFDGLSDVMIVMVDLVMKIAPLAVFALIMYTVADLGYQILVILFWYAATVLIGLGIHTFGIYGLILKTFSKTGIVRFFRGIREAQTIAFTTSSSAATLPVSMQCAEENLGISKSVTGFVLPLGATINMDGTALYQGVAAVFIAQVFGMDLTLTQQLSIVLMATLASIGTAPVPGVGILMLVVILKSVHIPEIGIALILGIDRILDMCRTTTNVTGDLAVATIVATYQNEIIIPESENPNKKEV